MSPEQAAGDRAVGPQADIYALGAVAYELLAGEPPFTGATAEAVLARVLVDEPRAIRTVRRTVPPTVEAAVLRALAKTPADRFRTAEEFATAVDARANPALTRRSAPRAMTGRAVRIIVGAAIAAAVTAAVIVAASTIAEPTRTTGEPARLSAPTRRQVTFAGNVTQAAISPDGEFLAYSTLDLHGRGGGVRARLGRR
jgi:serine/threonine-protein kinase